MEKTPAKSTETKTEQPATHQEGMSQETKTIIVVLCLLFLTPVGLILMWVWMKWPLWLKILLTILPFLFAFFIIGFMAWLLTMFFSNPDVQKQMKEQIQQQQQNNIIEISQTPTSLPNETETWETYKTPNFTFQYPPAYKVDSLGGDYKDDLYILPSGVTTMPYQGIWINARMQKNYDTEVTATKTSLIDIETKTIPNGIIIYGTLASGDGGGIIERKLALLKYKNTAIIVENLDKKISDDLFNQILSTFHFIQ